MTNESHSKKPQTLCANLSKFLLKMFMSNLLALSFPVQKFGIEMYLKKRKNPVASEAVA